MRIENCESDNIIGTLRRTLEELGYPQNMISQYVKLIEEALTKWISGLDAQGRIGFEQKDTRNDVVFSFSAEGEKLNPFSKKTVAAYDENIRLMYDKLMEDVGSELKYSYSRGKNRIELRLPRKNVKDTIFNRTAMRFTLVFALQVIIQNIASNIDVLMLSFKSTSAMSGASFASQVVVIHTIMLATFATTASSLLSQLYGQRKAKSMVYTLKLAVISAAVLNTAEFLVCFFLPEKIMSLYTDIPDLISEGGSYLKIVSVSFLLDSFYVLFYAFLRVADRRHAVTKFLAAGCAVNIFLNAVLIFGLFGLPEMGAAGAALATVVSAGVQLAASIVYFARERKLLFFAEDGSDVEKSKISGLFFKIGTPIVAQGVVYLTGVNFMAAAVGRLSVEIVAAYSLVMSVNSYLFSVKDGVGEVASIITGIQLGRNRFEDAKHNSILLRKLGARLGLVNIVLLFVLVLSLEMLPIKLSAEARSYILPITAIAAVNAFFGYQNCINNGILQSGGQSRTAFAVDAVDALCISVPLSLLSIYTGCFAPMVLLVLSKSDEVRTFLPKLILTNRDKWLKNIIDTNQEQSV